MAFSSYDKPFFSDDTVDINGVRKGELSDRGYMKSNFHNK
jgi:hypothetical protein